MPQVVGLLPIFCRSGCPNTSTIPRPSIMFTASRTARKSGIVCSCANSPMGGRLSTLPTLTSGLGIPSSVMATTGRDSTTSTGAGWEQATDTIAFRWRAPRVRIWTRTSKTTNSASTSLLSWVSNPGEMTISWLPTDPLEFAQGRASRVDTPIPVPPRKTLSRTSVSSKRSTILQLWRKASITGWHCAIKTTIL